MQKNIKLKENILKMIEDLIIFFNFFLKNEIYNVFGKILKK